MTTGLKIREVADASGFTSATLRYYEQIGLLPEASPTPEGCRMYDQRTLVRSASIRSSNWSRFGSVLQQAAAAVVPVSRRRPNAVCAVAETPESVPVELAGMRSRS